MMTTSVHVGITHFEDLNAVALEYQSVSVYHPTWVYREMRRERADATAAAAAVPIAALASVLVPIVDDDEEVDTVKDMLTVEPVEVPVEVGEEMVEDERAVDPVEVDERDLAELPVEEMVEKDESVDLVTAEDLSALVLADLGVNMSVETEETEKGVDAEPKEQSKRWTVLKVVSGVKHADARFLPRRNHRVRVA
ncbi:hypothetical protein AMAG_04578 [Allomyces macrogynus ATCC 38327]|uniref:Uncharacterized protein n=1 Tax=Allomyces macrogynus (strain ATCC 38327) TaxID=578462 RepID=A0A0L0S5S7_ALLM3|nr:hypothetical protein AMAG_04578 [Allomyces macrogynus ATCC 38327]|eukprot:KNE57719.1 hypothetical protein AMAG_04578 [Allomyces macrogynus ATCC 38327]